MRVTGAACIINIGFAGCKSNYIHFMNWLLSCSNKCVIFRTALFTCQIPLTGYYRTFSTITHWWCKLLFRGWVLAVWCVYNRWFIVMTNWNTGCDWPAVLILAWHGARSAFMQHNDISTPAHSKCVFLTGVAVCVWISLSHILNILSVCIGELQSEPTKLALA